MHWVSFRKNIWSSGTPLGRSDSFLSLTDDCSNCWFGKIQPSAISWKVWSACRNAIIDDLQSFDNSSLDFLTALELLEFILFEKYKKGMMKIHFNRVISFSKILLYTPLNSDFLGRSSHISLCHHPQIFCVCSSWKKLYFFYIYN